jgi:CheY-like chemotaxis protein
MSDTDYHVLIVEDDEIASFRYRETLESDGGISAVTITQSAEQALELLQQEQFDVVIIDESLQPNQKQGFEFLADLKSRSIRDFFGNRRVPVVMITGKTLSADEAIGLGAARFLVKPVIGSELTNIIKAVAAEGRSHSLDENLRERLSELRNAEDLYRKACQIAFEVFGVDSSGIVAFAEDGIRGYLAAQYALDEPLSDQFEIQVEGIPAEMALVNDRTPINFENLRGADAHKNLGKIATHLIERDGTVSILIVPIVVNDTVVASISIDSRVRRKFTKQDEVILQRLADQVATIFYFKRVVDSRAALYKAYQALFQTPMDTLPDLLRVLAAQAAQIMGTEQSGGAGIYVHDVIEKKAVLEIDTRFPHYQGITLSRGIGAAGMLIDPASKDKFISVPYYKEWDNAADVFDKESSFGSVLSVRLETEAGTFWCPLCP